MKILSMIKPERWKKYIDDPSFFLCHEIIYLPMDADADTVYEAGGDAEIILADAVSPVSGYLIRKMKNLKMIHSEGVGFNKIDVDAATECGVYVCNCKAMNATAVAEQTVLLMLGLLRNVLSCDRAEREGRAREVQQAYMAEGNLKELADCRIGFVGLGAVGKAAARICEAMGAELVYYDLFRLPEEQEKELNIRYLSLDELIKSSDIISLHLPSTEKTMHMVNKGFLSKMKEGSYLVNTSRGDLVVTEDLLEALKSGHLAGAGLDCVEGEPVTADNPILKADEETASKIILSPHIGGITGSSFRRGYRMIRENIEAVMRGEKPKRCIN